MNILTKKLNNIRMRFPSIRLAHRKLKRGKGDGFTLNYSGSNVMSLFDMALLVRDDGMKGNI